MFVSTTDQRGLGFKDSGHTFSALMIQPGGACIAAERAGGRALESKGLLVRYANPFVNDSPAPEVLYETKTGPLLAVAGSNGALWAVSSKDLHTNASGKWKASKPGIAGFYLLQGMAVVGGDVWLRDTDDAHRLSGGAWQTFAKTEERGGARSIAGFAPDDVYVMFGNFLAHFDGTTLARVEGAPHLGPLAIVGDEIVSGAGIGNRARGFRAPVAGKELAGPLLAALGGFVQEDSKHVWLHRDGTSERIMEATGWIAGAVAGDADVLWIGNGTELLCTNGTTWKTVARVHDDKTR